MEPKDFIGGYRSIHSFSLSERPFHTNSATRLTKTLQQPTTKLSPTHPPLPTSTSIKNLEEISIVSKTSTQFALPTTNTHIHSTPSILPNENLKEAAWLAPLLGAIGAICLFGLSVSIFLYNKRIRRFHSSKSEDEEYPNHHKMITTATTGKRGVTVIEEEGGGGELQASHESWASLSTIQVSEQTKYSKSFEPPNTSKAQKRLTADTLVEEPSILMLKNQYAPQLAFSPSLFAGEFQQNQEQPPLPMSSSTNTLIEHLEELGKENRRKTEVYDPSS